MKLVTFGRAMAPHGVGDKRLVPDDVAARLDGDGMLTASQHFGPDDAAAPTPRLPRRPMFKAARPAVTAAARIAR